MIVIFPQYMDGFSLRITLAYQRGYAFKDLFRLYLAGNVDNIYSLAI